MTVVASASVVNNAGKVSLVFEVIRFAEGPGISSMGGWWSWKEKVRKPAALALIAPSAHGGALKYRPPWIWPGVTRLDTP